MTINQRSVDKEVREEDEVSELRPPLLCPLFDECKSGRFVFFDLVRPVSASSPR